MSTAYIRNDSQRFCSHCHLPLTDFASSEAGVGPICAKKNTSLYARSIPANYAAATVILLSLKTELLPEEVRPRYESLRDLVLSKAQKASSKESDGMILQLQGQDLRSVVKEMDWILSFKMDTTTRTNLVNVVRYLGYVGLAGVLSQEASTSKASLWFDEQTGRVCLQGKSCKAGFWAMKKNIPGVRIPPRGSTEFPYSAPAQHAEHFLQIVQEFWPLYEIKASNKNNDANISQEGEVELVTPNIHSFLQSINVWYALNKDNLPQVKSMEGEDGSHNTEPTATLQVVSITSSGRLGTEDWIQVGFDWIPGKKDEMYGIVNTIKGNIPSQDRKYNSVTRKWTVRLKYQKLIEETLSKYFKIKTITS